MGTTSWRGQIDRALNAIDCIGQSKYAAKQAQDWQPVCSAMAIKTPSLIEPSLSPTGSANNIPPFGCFAMWITR